ncbi:MAG: creatininase family protein [Halobaculum sp.]
MELAAATWTDVRDAEPTVALVPVGSTEQHGPHAPLGTDTETARAVAAAADDRLEVASVVTPAVPVGVSAEHRAFDGTLWVDPDAFRAYVREIVTSLAASGIDRVVFVNGHGGNVEALAELARDCSRTGVAYTTLFTWFDAVDATDMGHAGPVETALLRHVAPETVRESRVENAAAEAADGWGEWVHGVNLAHDTDEFAPNGVVGDPRDGDADRGATLLDEAAEKLVDVVEAMLDREWSPD